MCELVAHIRTAHSEGRLTNQEWHGAASCCCGDLGAVTAYWRYLCSREPVDVDKTAMFPHIIHLVGIPTDHKTKAQTSRPQLPSVAQTQTHNLPRNLCGHHKNKLTSHTHSINI